MRRWVLEEHTNWESTDSSLKKFTCSGRVSRRVSGRSDAKTVSLKEVTGSSMLSNGQYLLRKRFGFGPVGGLLVSKMVGEEGQGGRQHS